MKTKETTCTKTTIRVPTGLQVTLGHGLAMKYLRNNWTAKAYARVLEDEYKELLALLKDHRSQAAAQAGILYEDKAVCSACGKEWSEEDGKCSWCGVVVTQEVKE